MTISRTGWMTAAVMAAAALIFLGLVTARKNWIGKLFQNGLLLLLCLCLTFPLVFGAVRYLPPVFHHPVWFWGEWSEDKVHSWDKWDSEKFVNLDRLMRSVNTRVANILDSLADNPSDDAQNQLPDAEVSDIEAVDTEAADTETAAAEVSPLQQQLYDEVLAEGYALAPADRTSGVKVRKAIYRYYFHLLNFRGHPDSEMGYQMLPDHHIGHAHNIYLQYGVEFGIPVMLLFILLIGWSAVGLVKQFAVDRSEKAAGSLFFLLVPALFGLLEYCWGAGSLAITLLFVIWRRMLCDEREQ
jgi:hypothetical protein